MKYSPHRILAGLSICAPTFADTQPTQSSQEQVQQLPEAEAHIRLGILKLNSLYEILTKINNKQSADAAAIEILKLQNELISWGQGFNALAPLTAVEQQQYEKAYLPIIKQINEQLKAQSARIHSAKYYDSKDLPQVLIQFVNRVK